MPVKSEPLLSCPFPSVIVQATDFLMHNHALNPFKDKIHSNFVALA
jgi:hypothetical protein